MPVQKQFRAYFRSPEWREGIRPRILARAGNRCESCKVPNHAHVVRCAGGMWYDQKVTWGGGVNGFWRDRTGQPATRPRGARARRIQIVLAVCHRDHTPAPENERDENLAAWCQWCHLDYDKHHHRESRADRKDRERPLLQAAL